MLTDILLLGCVWCLWRREGRERGGRGEGEGREREGEREGRGKERGKEKSEERKTMSDMGRRE